MKPNWKDAPEWANYLAMDDEGTWFWFEKEPTTTRFGAWLSVDGRVEVAMYVEWKQSLEKRPE